MWHEIVIAALGSYLCGSLPSGVIVARLMGLGDLRSIGSGNIGATNVLRTGSKKAAAATLILDMLKGLLPVALFGAWFGEFAAYEAMICAVAGHVFPVWLKFRGGKGVATFLGVMLGLSPLTGALCCLAWLIAAAAFRISSLAALLMSLCAPVLLWLTGPDGSAWRVLPLVLLIWVTHRENIGRIRRGEEPKIGKR